MKKYVCKEILKTGILLMCTELLFSVLLTIFIMFIGKFDTKILVTAIIVGFSVLVAMLLVTLLVLKQYFGKILIENDKINLYLFNKKYSFCRNQICIMYISPEITPRFTGKMLYSIKIRVKGEKNIIPIKIMDEVIIKELLTLLTIRREPQDFKFRWENKQN